MAKGKYLSSDSITLLEDLVYLQQTSGISIFEADFNIHIHIQKCITSKEERDMTSSMRSLLWIAYTKDLWADLDYEVRLAAQDHADMKDYWPFLSEYEGKIDQLLYSEEGFTSENKVVYDKVNKKLTGLLRSKENLKIEGKKRFLESYAKLMRLPTAGYFGLAALATGWGQIMVELFHTSMFNFGFALFIGMSMYLFMSSSLYLLYDWWAKKDFPKPLPEDKDWLYEV